METILYNISQVLGITIIHSLWQGLFVYFVLRLVLMPAAQLSASKKYLLAVTSLLAITGWFFYTLVNEVNIYHWLAVKPDKLSAMPLMAELPAAIGRFNDQTIRYYYSVEKYLPYITIIYVAGLLFNTARLILARKKIKAITHSMSIDIQLQQLVNTFTGVLNIGTKVKVGLSRMIDVPCMVGYFKPVILLPFTLSTYLSAEEIEAILLHELAHIKRNDYLVNMLQQVLSILLFFNPCALLINRIINEERENCCDDLVVKATADPMNYAKALLKLEQTRQNDWKLALAATGKKYHLLNRIQRIMKTQKPTTSVRPALLAMLILTAGISAVALLKPEIAQGKISVKKITPLIKHIITDTTNKSADKNTNHLKQHHSSKKTNHPADLRGNANTSAADPDQKLQKLNDDVQKKSAALNDYFNSKEFRATQKELEKKGKEIGDLYRSPEMQKKQEDLAKASADFAKTWTDDAPMKELTKQMTDLGAKVGVYYGSPEFKKLNDELEKKYGIVHNQPYPRDKKDQSENYKKYQAELQASMPAEIKQQTDQLKTLGEQMHAQYDSPEFKEQNQHLKQLAEDIKKTYSSVDFKRQQAEMKRAAEQMSAYQSNPQIKRAQKQLGESIRRMTDYINSDEYRKHLKDMVNSSMGNENMDRAEQKEKLEKPEKPEKPEQKEKDEAPEKPEN